MMPSKKGQDEKERGGEEEAKRPGPVVFLLAWAASIFVLPRTSDRHINVDRGRVVAVEPCRPVVGVPAP